MKIISIKWNPRVMDTTHIGEKTGTKFVSDEAKVSAWGSDRVTKIEEVNLTTYEIHYNNHGNPTKLRIFNPIEVLYDTTRN